jgi:hypothetical protein
MSYGRDLKTVYDGKGNVDLTPGMVESTGRDVLIESLIRRQTTPRGSVIDAPNDCIDVRDWLSDGLDQTRMQQLQGAIVQQLRRDERVDDASVSVTYDQSRRTLTIVETVIDSDGPFELTLTLSDETITIITSS